MTAVNRAPGFDGGATARLTCVGCAGGREGADVTEKANEPARVSVVDSVTLETRFRDVLDALFAFVGFFSQEGIVLETNRAPLAASGLQRAEVVGRRFVDLPWFAHSAEERARVGEAIGRAARGEASRFETSVRSTRGGVVAIDAAFAPVRGPEGSIKYIVGTGVDVSERRQAENEVRRAASGWPRRSGVAHLGSWEWEVAKNEVAWSDELYVIYGVEPRAHVPSYEAFLASVHPDDREHTSNVLRLAMQNLSPFVYDHRILRPDGSVRMLHTRGEVVGTSDGRVRRLVGSCWDITDRWDAIRAAEAARADAETSAAALRALARRLSEIREEERQTIARELHDQVGQALTALKLDLAGVRGQMAAGAVGEGVRGSRRWTRCSMRLWRRPGGSPRCCGRRSWTIWGSPPPSAGRPRSSPSGPACRARRGCRSRRRRWRHRWRWRCFVSSRRR